MLVYIGYTFCLCILALYLYFVFSKWHEIKRLNVQDKSSAISNGAQVVFLCLGSIVALYSLDVAIFSSERDQDIRTSEVLEVYDIDGLSERLDQYYELMSLIFDSRSWEDFNEDERIQKVNQIWESDLLSDYELAKDALLEISECVSTRECNPVRVSVAICREARGVIRFIPMEPVIKIPDEMLSFVYTSRDFFAERLWDSCRPRDYFADYLEGWLTQP